MRTAFIEELIVQARIYPGIFLIVGDLGYSVVEPFAAEFPDRFLNAGVAEQNMTGVAAGLASEGYHVFTYSIANFPTLRCLEQIRNDVCYHRLPVTVVAVGAGLAYGNLGYSHHGVQDLACLRGFPGLALHSPGDPGEARQAVRHLAAHPGPSYLRLGKAGERQLHSLPVSVLEPTLVRACGASLALVATGSILGEAFDAAELLAARGILCDVFSFGCPSAEAPYWVPQLAAYRTLLTIEEHVGPGGLGELIAAELPRSVAVERAFLPAHVLSLVGSQAWLRTAAALDAASLAQRAEAIVRG